MVNFSGVVNCTFHRIVIYRGIALSTELLNNWDYDGKVISVVFVAHSVNSQPSDQKVAGSKPAIALFERE